MGVDSGIGESSAISEEDDGATSDTAGNPVTMGAGVSNPAIKQSRYACSIMVTFG